MEDSRFRLRLDTDNSSDQPLAVSNQQTSGTLSDADGGALSEGVA
jgi:hypothetical protein